MNKEKREAFLSRPLTAVVSTTLPGGAPHSVPVWYAYEDGVFVVWTDAKRRWVRNLEFSDRVGVVVAEHEPPYAAVVVHGRAKVATDGPGADEAIRAITRRYMPEAEVDSYIRSWAALRTIVRITPRFVKSWEIGL